MDVAATNPHLKADHPSEIVETFPLARFRFLLQAETSIHLPGFKGSTLHSGLGHPLRSLSPHFHDLFFNPATDSVRAKRDLSWPFAQIPPLGSSDLIASGQTFASTLILFGNAIHRPGAITYHGPLQPFFPLLETGTWIGIGGKTCFGLGKYEMEIQPCTN